MNQKTMIATTVGWIKIQLELDAIFNFSLSLSNIVRKGFGGSVAGLHKTGIRGILDTRQIVAGKTNDIENNDKSVGSRFVNNRTHGESNLIIINKPGASSARHPLTHRHRI